jgi:predicted kinase
MYVLIAGLPGTGKSTLAGALASQLNGVVLSKDTVRATLFPGELTDYTREQDDLCFEMVLGAAAYLAHRSRAEFIFLDGRTFSRREQVERAVRAAVEADCGWRILLTTCPDAVAEARLLAEGDHHPAANRTVNLYRRLKARFEPIADPHCEVDTSQPLEASVQLAAAWLSRA